MVYLEYIDDLADTVTAISQKTEKRTLLRGYDLSDLAEAGYSFMDTMFVLFQDRIPTVNERDMLNYEMGVFMEHSMSPSAAGALGVIAGRPEIVAATGAGIQTFGAVHGPGAAHGIMMNHYLERAYREGKSIDEIAKITVDEHFDGGFKVIGMGQPQHIDGDPRAQPLHVKHKELELGGVYLEYQLAVEKYFHARRKKDGKTSRVGVNVIGAGNPALCDMGFSPNAAWALGTITRAYSCAMHAIHHTEVGHAWAASNREAMTQMLHLSMIKYVGPPDRPVPTQEERREYALAQKQGITPELKKRGVIGNLNDPSLPYNYSEREFGTIPLDLTKEQFQWVSEVGYKNIHRIVSRGYDTTELAEEGYGLTDLLFVDYQSRIPLVEESQMLDYVMILGLEDGLSQPTVIARAAADSNVVLTQACGASILGFGRDYGAYSHFGNMLQKYMDKVDEDGKNIGDVAKSLIKDNWSFKSSGVSTSLKDPSANRMIAYAEKLGVSGRYIAFMKEVVESAKEITDGTIDLGMTMLGATTATMMDLGFSPDRAQAILAVTKMYSSAAHFMETREQREVKLYQRVGKPGNRYVGVPERQVPSLDKRNEIAQAANVATLADLMRVSEERKKVPASGHMIYEKFVPLK